MGSLTTDYANRVLRIQHESSEQSPCLETRKWSFKKYYFQCYIRKVPHGLRDWGASNCDSESRKVSQTKIQSETNGYIETIKSFESRAFVWSLEGKIMGRQVILRGTDNIQGSNFQVNRKQKWGYFKYTLDFSSVAGNHRSASNMAPRVISKDACASTSESITAPRGWFICVF